MEVNHVGSFYSDPPQPLLTPKDVASLLRISLRSVYRRVRELRGFLLSPRMLRFTQEGIDAYLEEKQRLAVQVPVQRPVFSQYRRSRAQKRTDDKDPNRHGLLGPIISQRRGGV
jgi:predicted DNA-binding transcriptional regulator AlpA